LPETVDGENAVHAQKAHRSGAKFRLASLAPTKLPKLSGIPREDQPTFQQS